MPTNRTILKPTEGPWARRGSRVIALRTGEVIADLRPRTRQRRDWRADGDKMAASPILVATLRRALRYRVVPARWFGMARAALRAAGEVV